MMSIRIFLGTALVISWLIFGSSRAFAAGHSEGNGGDACENRIQTIRDDISGWIISGGSSALGLPVGISHQDYVASMGHVLKVATISCVQDPIIIGGAFKTCRNFVDAGVQRIECNFQRFAETSESDQYVLVHHEYAGLSGFEVNDGADSNYQISNQLSEILELQVVKKLPIKKAAAGRCGFANIAGIYGGNFFKNVGPGVETGFPIKLTVLVGDEPDDLNAPCPSVQIYYTRPDLKSNAGTIIAAGNFDPVTGKLDVFNEGIGGGGLPGHLHLDMRGVWGSTKFVGRMIWWQFSGTFSLAKCAGNDVSEDGICL